MDKAWGDLLEHFADVGETLDMRELFKTESDRVERMSIDVESGLLYADFSKNGWEAVTHASLFWFKEKTKDPVRTIASIPSGHKAGFAKVFHALLKSGVYLAPSGYEVGFLSTAHTESILQETLSRAETGLKQEFHSWTL